MSEADRRRGSLGGLPRRASQVAAILVAFMIGGASIAFWAGGSGVDGGRDDVISTGGEVVTGVGETTTARLHDGTVIRLAPQSRLFLPASPGEREVTLEGKAFFAVASNPDNPFLVRTPAGEARVLGTRFELDVRQDELRLLVVDGRVALATERTEIDVRSQQLTYVRSGEDPLTLEIEDVWPLLAWMGDFLAFESTPLSEVRLELKRRFGVELEFHHPSLAEETVTVWFGAEPIEEVVLVLCRLTDTSCSLDNSQVHMTRRR